MKTPIEKVKTLSMDTILDDDRIQQIKNMGFSRIPISFDRENFNKIIGVLLAKSLIGLAPSDKTIEYLLKKK